MNDLTPFQQKVLDHIPIFRLTTQTIGEWPLMRAVYGEKDKKRKGRAGRVTAVVKALRVLYDKGLVDYISHGIYKSWYRNEA